MKAAFQELRTVIPGWAVSATLKFRPILLWW